MKSKLLATALASLVAASASASGYQVNTLGLKNNGMGHTGTGLALDQAALFFNPGALAMVRQNGVQLGVSAVISRTKFSEPNTFAIAEVENNVSTPFHFYGSYGFMEDQKLRVGIGVYTPFGSTVEYQAGWIGENMLDQLSLQTIFVQPTVSYAFSDKVSIGAGFVYAFGGVNLQRNIPLTDINGNNGQAELDGKASGMGFNVGVYVKPSEKISLGVSYRSKVDMEVSGGDATFTGLPAAAASNFTATQFDASLPMPSSLNFGIGVMPTEKLTIAADVNLIGWSAYESLDFTYNGTAGGVTSSSSPRKYEDSYAVRLGTQYMVTESFALRLGAYYDKTPVQAGFMTAETPDSDRIGITGGLGYRLGEHFNLDLSLIYIEGKERTQTQAEVDAAGTTASTLAGTWKTKVLLPGIGLTVNF